MKRSKRIFCILLILAAIFSLALGVCAADAPALKRTPKNGRNAALISAPQTEQTASVTLGDLNGDDALNMKDLLMLRRALAGGYGVTAELSYADINQDGELNAKDLLAMRQKLAGGYEGGTTNATFTTRRFSYDAETNLDYWLFTPANAKSGMPLIVYLHGKSQKGNDINTLTENGLCKWTSEGNFDQLPAYIIFPQLPAAYQGWKDVMPQIKALIEAAVSEYHIDPDNVNLTGHSMGGIGTYAIANEYPELFSSIAPLSGSITKTNVVISNLSRLSLWAFVAKEDRYVSPNASINLATALFDAGKNARVTVLDGATHFTVPELVYLNSEFDILGWLIQTDAPMAEQAVTTITVG